MTQDRLAPAVFFFGVPVGPEGLARHSVGPVDWLIYSYSIYSFGSGIRDPGFQQSGDPDLVEACIGPWPCLNI